MGYLKSFISCNALQENPVTVSRGILLFISSAVNMLPVYNDYRYVKITEQCSLIKTTKIIKLLQQEFLILLRKHPSILLNSSGTSIIGAWPHLSIKCNSLFGISREILCHKWRCNGIIVSPDQTGGCFIWFSSSPRLLRMALFANAMILITFNRLLVISNTSFTSSSVAMCRIVKCKCGFFTDIFFITTFWISIAHAIFKQA